MSTTNILEAGDTAATSDQFTSTLIGITVPS